jgi:hypothetical protein
MSHSVVAILTAVAIPFTASVLEPVAPDSASVRVSDVMAIVSVLALFTNISVVPILNGTAEFAGIVNVLGLLSDEGWRSCLLASRKTAVYAALCEFCAIASSTMSYGTD